MTIATPRRFRRAMPPMVLMAAVTCSAFAQPGIESAPLDLREAVERSLETGDVHSYTFELDESQFVYLVANQKTVDVKVTVYNPGGETVGVYDGPARGPESVQFFSRDAGVYRVEVTPFESEQGEYVIELRRADAKATTPEGLVGQMIAPYDDPHTPGGVVAVVRDGEIIFAETFGAKLGEGEGGSLLVAVHQQQVAAGKRAGDREVDGERGLANAALCVPDYQYHSALTLLAFVNRNGMICPS